MASNQPKRQEFLTWNDVDKLIDHIIPQFNEAYDAILTITRGGIVPGGILAEALDIKNVLTAAVDFPELDVPGAELLAWPAFLQFPDRKLLANRKILVVDDVWGSGRTASAVGDMVQASNGVPYLCVLHFNPYRNLFKKHGPDYYGAVTDAYIIYPWEMRRGTDFEDALTPSPIPN